MPKFEESDWYRVLTKQEQTEWAALREYIQRHPDLDQMLVELDLAPGEVKTSDQFYSMVMLAVHFRSMNQRANHEAPGTQH